MPGEKTLVSIVCPAFQEEELLPHFHAELGAVLAGLESDYRFEILYVEDGSPDRTLAVIKELARLDPRVGFVSLTRNFGHQVSLTAGLEHARGDVVISMDTDLQHPPAVLPRLLEQWRAGHEVVITVRADDRRLGLFKRLSSNLFYRVMAQFSDTDVRLAASDFRLLSRKALQALLQMRENHRFLRGMVQWLGFPAAEVRFTPDERRAGMSKYTMRRLIRLAGDGLFSFSRIPLRMAFHLGVLVILVGLVHSGWLCWRGWSGNEPSAGVLVYLLLFSHLLTGTVLCALGVLGEYVGRIYEQVKGRPLYVLKEHAAPASAALGSASDGSQRAAA